MKLKIILVLGLCLCGLALSTSSTSKQLFDVVSKEIDSLINLHEFQNSTVKVKVIGGTRFVVRGVVGRKGDVLVDNLSAPTSILGVCDGDGNVESSSYEHLEELLRKVQSIS